MLLFTNFFFLFTFQFLILGVVSHFFGPRWKLFLTEMNESLINNKGFNETHVKMRVFKEVELPFTYDKTLFPKEAKGNA